MARLKIEKLQVAGIGVGGKGHSDVGSMNSHPDVEIVACCDTHSGRLQRGLNDYGGKGYADFREMLTEMGGQIDAVTVSTPDHTHYPAAMMALKMDKHVYCQKPLTWSVWESRMLSQESEARPDVATQMGTQSASKVHKRQSVEAIRSGMIGRIHSIHAWTNRPIWPQGNPRKEGSDPIPKELSWDLWLGPAEERPYKNGSYDAFNWRGVYDFGCGAIGDMACHIVDTPFYALDLQAPMAFRSDCSDATDDQFPSKQVVSMTFPGSFMTTRDSLPVLWYDGSILPNPEEIGLTAGTAIPQNCCAVVGEEGTLIVSTDDWSRLYRNGVEVPFVGVELETRNHYHHWVDACFGRNKTVTHFEFSARLTEAFLLGSLGSRFPGESLIWDAENMRITNKMEANAYLKREARKGWRF
jgi:predicted dehydrogenase